MNKSNGKKNGKSKTASQESANDLESLKDLGVAATAAARAISGLFASRHVQRLARMGVEPTEEQYAAAEADPATDWLLVAAVQLRDQIRKMTLSAPSYVQARFPRPSMVTDAIASRVAYLCGPEALL